MLVMNPLSREDKIEELELPAGTESRLKHEGVETIGALVDHSVLELMDFPRFGEVTIRKVQAALKIFGYQLSAYGMEHERPKIDDRPCRCHGPYRSVR